MFFIILSQDYEMLSVHSDCSDCFAGGKQRIKELEPQAERSVYG